MEPKEEQPKLGTNINYYVITAIFVGLLIYSVGNAIEPDIDSELDPFEAPQGIGSVVFHPIPEYDFDFYKEYVVGTGAVFLTTMMFSYAVVGAQVFRGTILGNAWGLLLVGFALNTFGDVRYYFF